MNVRYLAAICQPVFMDYFFSSSLGSGGPHRATIALYKPPLPLVVNLVDANVPERMLTRRRVVGSSNWNLED